MAKRKKLWIVAGVALVQPLLVMEAIRRGIGDGDFELLATLGIAAVGTVFAAMAVNTRSREVMLPLLFLPIVLPVVVAAVEASGVIIGGGDVDGLARLLPLLGVFDAVFLVVCPLAFNIVVQE